MMKYNVISNPASMEAILKDCEAAGKQFYMELSSGWYNASLFFGAGCSIDYTVNQKGDFTDSSIDIASSKGVKALQGMISIAVSPAFVDGSSADSATNAAALVSGTWDLSSARELFGEGYAAAKLPSVNGFQMYSFLGSKLIGVRPQDDSERLKTAKVIAEYLSSTDAQVLRHDEMGWLPARNSARKKITLNSAEKALLSQSAYSVPQSMFPSSYWSVSSSFANNIIQQASTLVNASSGTLMSYLTDYQQDLKSLSN